MSPSGSGLLLAVIVAGCTNTVDPPGPHVMPGIGSSYMMTELTQDDDPASPDRFDSVGYTVAARVGSYQGMQNVTQCSGPRQTTLYLLYHENGYLSRYYSGTYFNVDAYLRPPYWVKFPYGGSGKEETVLFDTVDGGRRISYRFAAEEKGAEEVEIDGMKLTGRRLDYTFTFRIEEEDVTITTSGRTLYVPSIGWAAWTEETTERRQEGGVTSRTSKRSELVEYVVVRDA